jgi:hypothetical protein
LDKIVCSQLVYLSYEKIEWPTERVVGRYTISPDNIAAKALDEGPFNLIRLDCLPIIGYKFYLERMARHF